MSLEMLSSHEDMQLLLETVRGLVASRVETGSKAIDEESEIPPGVYRALVDAGLHAAGVPEAFGGGGASLVESTVLVEEVAKGSGAVALILAMNAAGIAAISSSSNEQAKAELLPAISSGEAISVWPADSFREQEALIASASSGGLVINGQLHWVPCFEVGATVLLLAEVATEGVSHLVAIDVASPESGRIELGPLESDLGLRGAPLRSLSMDNVAVSHERILASGSKRTTTSETLGAVAKVSVAGLANGIAGAALRHAKEYVLERQQFGRPIGEFESTRKIIGEMALALEVAHQLTVSAALQLDGSNPLPADPLSLPIETSAKWFACKAAVEVAINSVQLFGGYGFVKDYPVERLMRDAKMAQLILGTDQLVELGTGLLEEVQ